MKTLFLIPGNLSFFEFSSWRSAYSSVQDRVSLSYFRMKKFCVLPSRRTKFKIFYGIIHLVLVSMMHYLASLKKSSQMLLHHKSVLGDVSLFTPSRVRRKFNINVSTSNYPATFPVRGLLAKVNGWFKPASFMRFTNSFSMLWSHQVILPQSV